jgi:hypothetical protein
VNQLLKEEKIMKEHANPKESGQSIVVIAVAVVVLLIFAVIAVDLAYGYVHRRGDQNAADAAALAGARELADILNSNNGSIPGGYLADSIKVAMNDFAERNGVEDSGGIPGDVVNENVVGYYLDASGDRITDQNGNAITINEGGFVNPNARGIEAIANSVAPTFFGGVVGLDGLPISADSAVVFSGDVCTMNCIAPIATYTMTFQTDDNDDNLPCYNIWDGTRQQSGGGNCPDWGNCTGGTCQLNSNITCSSKADCSGVCPGGGFCSLPLGSSLPCDNNSDCTADYGNCKSGTCRLNGSVTCTTNDDCKAVCQSGGWLCSGGSNAGNPCEEDADCPDGFCEDDVSGSGSSSGLGWLNWSLQGSGHSCRDVGEPDDCSTPCLIYNLTPDTCLSGDIEVGDWVAGASGIKNASGVRSWLQWYIDTETPMTVVVYDDSQGRGCNHSGVVGSGHLEYHTVGFAQFKVIGYGLSQGGGNDYGYNGANCEDWGMEGNRITGVFLGWVSGSAGDCDTNGTIVAPRVVR